MMPGNRGEISNFFAGTGKRGPRTADILWLIRRKKISNCAASIRQTISGCVVGYSLDLRMNTNSMEGFQMILTDEICDKLCAAAREKSKELGIDISFAVSDENGLPRVYRRYGKALVLSITLVPGKAYTAAVTQCKTKDVAAAAAEGASLMAIQTNDPRITLVAGGYPLFVNGKIAGGIGVGGGTEEQDCEIAEYVVSIFEKLAG